MFSKSQYRLDVQALRGLAVLAVVLFHVNEGIFPLGYLGVDIFFVISGFVVTPLILRIFAHQKESKKILHNLKYFYKRRFYRLAPALACTLLISSVAIFLLAPISDHQRFAKQGIATLLLVGNAGAYKYSGGNYFADNPNPLVHTWSLSVEEQIYIFLPLILIISFSFKSRIQKASAMVLGVILIVSFLSFSYPELLQPLYSRAGIMEPSQFSFYSPLDRIWQFALGGLGFLFLSRNNNRVKQLPKGILLTSVLSIFAILFGPVNMNPKIGSILASLFTLFVILSKSLHTVPQLLFKKLEWLGDRSYSIYLVHMPIVYILKYALEIQIGNQNLGFVQEIIAVITSIALGALSYEKIEMKYRDYGKEELTSLKTRVLTLFLVFSLPLTLFATMDYGQKKHYWGLDRNIPQPPYAGFLDPNCERDSGYGPCNYVRKGATRSVVLFGDSHAGHLSQAVVDAAALANWNSIIWIQSGCSFRIANYEKGVSDSCIKNNKQKVEWLSQNIPDLVIISQSISSESNLFELKNGISSLLTITPKILLIKATPVFPDRKDFMVARPIIRSPYHPPKSFLLKKMESGSKINSEALASWAENRGISTMDFTPLFCNQNSCSRFLDGFWLYRDSSHLSVAGAQLTIPQLTEFLEKL